MSDDLIRRARDLLDGITPGPWRAEPRAAEYYDLTTVYNVFHNGDTWDRDLVASVAYDNAEFIAAAPELVTGLLAEVERLRDVVAAIRDEFVVHQRYTPEIEEEDGSQRQADT